MTTKPTTQAAERLATLFDLARKHDDDVNYAEVELLLAASKPRLALREASLPTKPAHSGEQRRFAASGAQLGDQD